VKPRRSDDLRDLANMRLIPPQGFPLTTFFCHEPERTVITILG
jgi:hypothetical protein